jgi:hypothetical protein
VAIDGIRFKAVINRDKNFTKGKITSRLAHLGCANRVMAEVPRRRLCSDSDAACSNHLSVAALNNRPHKAPVDLMTFMTSVGLYELLTEEERGEIGLDRSKSRWTLTLAL